MARLIETPAWAEGSAIEPLLAVPSVKLGFVVEHYQHAARELEQPPMADDVLGMTISHPVGIERKLGAKGRHERHDPGALHIIGAGSEARWQFDQPLDSLHLRMTPAFLLRTFGEQAEGVRLADVDLIADRRVSQLVLNLFQRVKADNIVDLDSEAVAAQIAHQLLENHPSGSRLRTTRKSGLSAKELTAVDGYLRDRMDQPVSVADIADEAMLSPFHLMRLFKLTTGDTLYNHALSLRLERARMLLRATSLTVAEIAVETGFHDESHFIKKFRVAAGMNPTAFRTQR